MSSEKKKSEGAFEGIGGKIKEAVGGAVGNERMRAEGEAQRLRGEERREEGKAELRAEGTKDELVGKVKNRVGALLGDRKNQAEGRAKELSGEELQAENRSSRPSAASIP